MFPIRGLGLSRFGVSGVGVPRSRFRVSHSWFRGSWFRGSGFRGSGYGVRRFRVGVSIRGFGVRVRGFDVRGSGFLMFVVQDFTFMVSLSG